MLVSNFMSSSAGIDRESGRSMRTPRDVALSSVGTKTMHIRDVTQLLAPSIRPRESPPNSMMPSTEGVFSSYYVMEELRIIDDRRF